MSWRTALLSWLFLYTAAICLLGAIVHAPSLIKLSNRSKTVRGTVISSLPHSHGTVLIHYDVGGTGFDTKVGPSNLAVGTPVTVYYCADDPHEAVIEEPDRLLSRSVITVSFAAFLFASVIVGRVFIGRVVSRSQPHDRRQSWALDARLTAVVVLGGSLVGITISLFGGTLVAWRGASGVLSLGGCLMLVRCAWREGGNWQRVVRSRLFWGSAALILFSQIAQSISPTR